MGCALGPGVAVRPGARGRRQRANQKAGGANMLALLREGREPALLARVILDRGYWLGGGASTGGSLGLVLGLL